MLNTSLLSNSTLKRPVCCRDSTAPAPFSKYSRLPSKVNLRTARMFLGRGLKRPEANDRVKLLRRRNPTSGLKSFPTFSTLALAP